MVTSACRPTARVAEAKPATPAPIPAPSTTQAASVEDLYSQLPDYANPTKIFESGKAALLAGDGQGFLKAKEDAQKAAEAIAKDGKLTVVGPDGKPQIVTVPGWNEWKKQQEMLPKNLEMFAKYPDTILNIEKADYNNQLFAKIGENFEPNYLANVQGTTQAVGRALGIEPSGANAELKANLERLGKDTNQALFADLKENVGPGQRLLLNEIQNQKQAEPTGTMQPEAYRTLVGQKIGTTNWVKDYYRDAGIERKKVGDANFDGESFTRNWTDSHSLSNYIANATANVAVKGATPLNDTSRMIPGQMYVVDKDPQGKSLKTPFKARYNGINPQTNKFIWNDVAPLQVVH